MAFYKRQGVLMSTVISGAMHQGCRGWPLFRQAPSPTREHQSSPLIPTGAGQNIPGAGLVVQPSSNTPIRGF